MTLTAPLFRSRPKRPSLRFGQTRNTYRRLWRPVTTASTPLRGTWTASNQWMGWSPGNGWTQCGKCMTLSRRSTLFLDLRAVSSEGEASMWSEQVDTATLDARMRPRASAVAERLWSPRSCTDHEYAAWRLREHRCRMVARGIGAGPFWSEHCAVAGGRE